MTQYAYPPPQHPGPRPPRVSRRVLFVALAAAASLVVALGAVVAVLLVGAPAAAATSLEGVNTAGANPFMPTPGGTDAPNVASPAGASGPVSGATPGLFGGTGDNHTCDRDQMIEFLAAHPDRGQAWADAVGIGRSDIPAFLRQLSPMILRSDTAVTNHGYSGGELTTFPSVLQAGTAVMVDGYGTPRVKCYCGNPLAAPPQTLPSRYEGQAWARFAPVTVIVIQPAPVVINHYTIINIYNNTYYNLVCPRYTFGKDGSGAGPSSVGPTSTTTTTVVGSGGGAGPPGNRRAPDGSTTTTSTTTTTSPTTTTTTTEESPPAGEPPGVG